MKRSAAPTRRVVWGAVKGELERALGHLGGPECRGIVRGEQDGYEPFRTLAGATWGQRSLKGAKGLDSPGRDSAE